MSVLPAHHCHCHRIHTIMIIKFQKIYNMKSYTYILFLLLRIMNLDNIIFSRNWCGCIA